MNDFMTLKGPDGETSLSEYLFPDGTKSLPLQQFTAVQFKARAHNTVFTLGHTPKGDLQAIMLNEHNEHVPVWRILCDANARDIMSVANAHIAALLKSLIHTAQSRHTTDSATLYKNGDNRLTTFTWPGSATTP